MSLGSAADSSSDWIKTLYSGLAVSGVMMDTRRENATVCGLKSHHCTSVCEFNLITETRDCRRE